MHTLRIGALGPVLPRAAALALGLVTAWACRSPEPDDCPQGSNGCACALGFCDDGLTCIADVCMPADAGTGTTEPTTTGSSLPTTTDDASSSTAPAESSSEGTGLADSSSSSGELPTDPILAATVDGVPSSFDIDPHAYLSPAGIMLVRGSESGGMGAELILRIPPTGPGTHTCIEGETEPAIYWTIQGPMGVLELSTRTSGLCSITVDAYGEVGEVVSGTFEGEVRYPGAREFPPVAITDGVFRVTRTPDE